jgi:hypothetical protein
MAQAATSSDLELEERVVCGRATIKHVIADAGRAPAESLAAVVARDRWGRRVLARYGDARPEGARVCGIGLPLGAHTLWVATWFPGLCEAERRDVRNEEVFELGSIELCAGLCLCL